MPKQRGDNFTYSQRHFMKAPSPRNFTQRSSRTCLLTTCRSGILRKCFFLYVRTSGVWHVGRNRTPLTRQYSEQYSRPRGLVYRGYDDCPSIGSPYLQEIGASTTSYSKTSRISISTSNPLSPGRDFLPSRTCPTLTWIVFRPVFRSKSYTL